MRLLRGAGWRLGSVLTWMAVVGLAVALVVQDRRAERRERLLRSRLIEAAARRRASDRMRYLLADLGIAVLRAADEVEILRLTGPAEGGVPRSSANAYVLAPTGMSLGSDRAARLARVLLDERNYSYAGADDLPEPDLGLRVACGQGRLDILLDVSPGHVDMWVGDSGPCESPGWRGPACMYDDDLCELAEKVRDAVASDAPRVSSG